MNVQDTIYFKLAAYASITPNRAAALNHLFCTIGNGYEWKNGQLVDTVKYPRKVKTLEQKIAITLEQQRKADEEFEREYAHFFDTENPAIEEEIDDEESEEEESVREFDELRAIVAEASKWRGVIPDDIEARMLDTKFNDWYALSEYSAMMNIPKNIQEDWLDAIIETASLILTQPIMTRFYRSHFASEEEYQNACNTVVERNEQRARAVLEKALSMKK